MEIPKCVAYVDDITGGVAIKYILKWIPHIDIYQLALDMYASRKMHPVILLFQIHMPV